MIHDISLWSLCYEQAKEHFDNKELTCDSVAFITQKNLMELQCLGMFR